MTSPTARRFVRPRDGDTLAAIAARELAGVSLDRALEQLLAWNPHLAARGGGYSASARGMNPDGVPPLLVSDTVFVEEER